MRRGLLGLCCAVAILLPVHAWAAAPTFVTEVEVAFDTGTTPKATGSFAVQVDDVLVACGLREGGGGTISTPTNTGTALTWTLRQSVVIDANWAAAYVWTAPATVAESITVSFNSAGGQHFGGGVKVWRGSSGVGASSKTNVDNTGTGTAPSLSLTTTESNSAVVMCLADWNALDGASRAYNTASAGTFTERSYTLDAGVYAVYAGYYADASAAGAKTLGLTAPTGLKYSVVAVEVKGTGGGGPDVTTFYRRKVQ